MNTERPQDAIIAFVTGQLGSQNIDADRDLFQSGMANSLFAMQLVLYVEKTFGIEVTDDDLDVENFKSLAAISAFVDGKLSEQR